MKTPSQLLQSFLLINLVLISCTHSNSPIIVPSTISTDTTKSELLTFDLKRLPDLSTIKLSDIGAVDIEYVPLETAPRNVIQNIYNIRFCDDFFMIRENSSRKAPSLFRNDGSFITEVGTVGRGPNEFTGVSDIDIDPVNESIYIAVGLQPKFLVYNKNGKFLRTFRNPVKGEMSFKFTKDGILCYYNNSQGNIKNSFILIDTLGNIIKKFPNKYPWKRNNPGAGFTFENIFYRSNNQLYKKEIYCDTVFLYDNKIFKQHIIIDVGNLRLTQNVRKNAKTRTDSEVLLHNFLSPFNLFEFGNFIYYEMAVTINGTHDLFSFVGSKQNDFRTMIVATEGFVNDLDGGPNIWPKTVKDDNTIVSWIEAMKLKEYFASDAFKNSNPINPDNKIELEKLANSLKATDNPVLMLVRLKK